MSGTHDGTDPHDKPWQTDPRADTSAERIAEIRQLVKEERALNGKDAADLLAKIADLERWKREQLTVESWWQKIDAAVRAHPDIRLGECVADVALRLIQERDATAAKIQEPWLSAIRNAMKWGLGGCKGFDAAKAVKAFAVLSMHPQIREALE